MRNLLDKWERLSRYSVNRLIAWAGSLIFSVSLLSIYHFGHIWLGHMLVVMAVAAAVTLFGRAEKGRRQAQPVPYLSRGCNTVWKLDREG